jgi:hypothetical protein
MGDGQHARGVERRRRRTIIIVAAIVVGVLVFVVGYEFGAEGGGETAASSTPNSTPSPTATSSGPASQGPSGGATPAPEPSGNGLGDGRYFVRLTDLQGGEEGPLLLRYDLAYFYTGDEANQVAASRGDETPVPNDTYVVNDNPKLRLVPLAEQFAVRYLPEGSGLTEPVPAPQDRFLVWLDGTEQTDLPPKDMTYWWITISNGEVTKVEQQYQP